MNKQEKPHEKQKRPGDVPGSPVVAKELSDKDLGQVTGGLAGVNYAGKKKAGKKK